MTTHHRRFVGIVAAIALGVAACASGTAESTTQPTPAPTTTEATTSTTHPHPPATVPTQGPTANAEAQISLSNAMRDLWTDHMFWTYATVDAFFNNTAELEADLNRLLANQIEIGNAIKPFFGDAAGDELGTLLTEHIQLAVPVLTAAQDGDSTALETALADWYQNAADVAEFVSAAGPDAWPLEVTEPMLKGHIDSTVIYATALLEGDFTAAIAEFDKANDHMMMLAEALAAGIISQFPEEFAS